LRLSMKGSGMTLTHKLMLGLVGLIATFAAMTVLGGSVEAAATPTDGASSWQMDVDGEPKATVSQAHTCVSSTIFHTPLALTAVDSGRTGFLGGASPEAGGPCQVVVQCTLTHWGWHCVVTIVCP